VKLIELGRRADGSRAGDDGDAWKVDVDEKFYI
jgi:hypothetical protein